MVSPIWLVPDGTGGMRALLLQNTFALMLLALVAWLPGRTADVPAPALLRPVA